MLNVCFGDSERGTLKCALNSESVTHGRLLLDLGHISADTFEEDRRNWINLFFRGCSKLQKTNIWLKERLRFNKMIKTIKEEKQVRIWYASSACSRCGLYHVVYSLKDVDCKIFVVEMPNDVGFRRFPEDKSWGEANPKEMFACLALEREISKEERELFTKNWERLSQENAELRLNLEGEVTSVLIDYLDKEILSYAPKDKVFPLGLLIGKTLGNCRHGISDSFVADRVEAMINGGSLTLVGERPKKACDYYSKTFIRVSTEEDVAEHTRKGFFIMDFLSNLGIDAITYSDAISDDNLEKSYNTIMKHPKMTKRQALKRLKLEEYVPSHLPPSQRDYNKH